MEMSRTASFPSHRVENKRTAVRPLRNITHTTHEYEQVNHASLPAGSLDPKENALITVSCDAFAYGQEVRSPYRMGIQDHQREETLSRSPDAGRLEDTNNDRVTIEWTNTPDGAAKQSRREWFQGDSMVRRKNLPTEYTFF